MLIVAVLAILVIFALVLSRRPGSGDGPTRIVAAAARRLPAYRREWGRAMAVELAQVKGGPRRWRFAAGVLRVALFPPPRHRGRVLAVALGALAVTAVGTLAAVRAVPSLGVFAATFGLLLCGLATAVAARAQQRPTLPRVLVAAVALAGVAGTIASVVAVAVIHPAAATDDTHLFAIVFAIVLTTYLAVAVTAPRLGENTNTVLWWGLGGAFVSGASWVAIAAIWPMTTVGVIGLVSPVGAAATFVVSVGVAAITRDSRAGIRAGVLTGLLGALMSFTVNVVELLRLPAYPLTDPYDIAAFARSGLPDTASYILSDALGGEIISGLVLYPLVLTAVALVSATVGSRAPGTRMLVKADQR
jgi:hypothetical protein